MSKYTLDTFTDDDDGDVSLSALVFHQIYVLVLDFRFINY